MEFENVSELFEKLFSKIDSLSERMIEMETSQKGFWLREWPSVIKTVSETSARVGTLELELAKLKTKIAISGAVVVFLLTSALTISTSYISSKTEAKEEKLYEILDYLRNNKVHK